MWPRDLPQQGYATPQRRPSTCPSACRGSPHLNGRDSYSCQQSVPGMTISSLAPHSRGLLPSPGSTHAVTRPSGQPSVVRARLAFSPHHCREGIPTPPRGRWSCSHPVRAGISNIATHGCGREPAAQLGPAPRSSTSTASQVTAATPHMLLRVQVGAIRCKRLHSVKMAGPGRQNESRCVQTLRAAARVAAKRAAA